MRRGGTVACRGGQRKREGERGGRHEGRVFCSVHMRLLAPNAPAQRPHCQSSVQRRRQRAAPCGCEECGDFAYTLYIPLTLNTSLPFWSRM